MADVADNDTARPGHLARFGPTLLGRCDRSRLREVADPTFRTHPRTLADRKRTVLLAMPAYPPAAEPVEQQVVGEAVDASLGDGSAKGREVAWPIPDRSS